MLEIKCDDYYKRVVEFAEKKGLKAKLEERLDYLRKFADHEEKGLCKVELKKDFAPASFSVAWFKKTESGDYVYWFNGGLIFHGDQSGWDDTGTYVDPLSVVVGTDDNPWGIHT
jgi:Domain of unknown function (DUF4120)